MTATTQKIAIHVKIHQEQQIVDTSSCLIYNQQDAYALHTKHKIIGRLIGSLPSHADQEIFHALPMLLLPESVTLGIELGIVELFTHQFPVTQVPVQGFPKQFPPIDKQTYFTTTSEKQQQQDGDDTSKQQQVTHLWPLETIQKTMLYKVYKDLHAKGYFISTGDKFGVDYLIYHNDPLCYHACGMVYVVQNATENIFQARSITSLTRVANQTRKTLVIASEHLGSVKYLCWKWFRPAIKQKEGEKPEITDKNQVRTGNEQDDQQQGGLSDSIL